MSAESDRRSEEFLHLSDQFQLGELTTESSHPITAGLSAVAQTDIGAALRLLFDVDQDVLRVYREFVDSGRAGSIAATVAVALRSGGKLFFTGCGSTGRLSIQLVCIWRDFWQQQARGGLRAQGLAVDLEQRAFAIMAGGDYALIKSVEGFEDFAAFGKKQLADAGVGPGDVVFAITEGGETSFVIGTAWKGLEAGAKVYFVYNNPDEVLGRTVERSREVLEEQRIEKLNLTTGPMAITGSTRMQATTIQLCVLVTVLEMVAREFMCRMDPGGPRALPPGTVGRDFLARLNELHAILKSPAVLEPLARLVALEQGAYRVGHKNNYFADRLAIDVLTDTTERSPTYCTPPFRKFDDTSASESWAFLFTAANDSETAWRRIIKRQPVCVEWTELELGGLVGADKLASTREVLRKISYAELMRFKVGLDGLASRPVTRGDISVAVISEQEKSELLDAKGFYRKRLEEVAAKGAAIGLIFFGGRRAEQELKEFLKGCPIDCQAVAVPVPEAPFLLDGLTRVCVKVVLNALSTCTMVRLGRVMGNFMIWVVPSNLKLMDRATRYIQKLTGLGYRPANRLLFEVIEYVTPRMRADQAYPPVVALSVMRARSNLSNEEAEKRLRATPAGG